MSQNVPVALPPNCPTPTLGSPYSVKISGINGTPPYNLFALSTLPPGMSLAADGTFSGTPTAGGTFTVGATDSSVPQKYGARTFNLPSPSVSGLGLLRPADLTYLGAFRLTALNDAVSTLDGAGTALAYNAANNSLFVSSGTNSLAAVSYGAVGEWNVATPSLDPNQNNWPLAANIQGWRDVVDNVNVGPLGTDLRIGGLLVYQGALIGNIYTWFVNSDISTDLCNFKVSNANNLAGSTITGMFNSGGRAAAGGMTLVPSALQASLGFPVLQGTGNLPRIGTSSVGPSLWGVDPATFSASQASPRQDFAHYPDSNGLRLGIFVGTTTNTTPPFADPMQCGTLWQGGLAFVPGTKSLLVFSGSAITGVHYGPPGNEGPHSVNEQYGIHVHAYSLDELLQVKNGVIQDYQAMPYLVWDVTSQMLNLPFNNGSNNGNNPGGVAVDPVNRLIYVAMQLGDPTQGSNAVPNVHVFQYAATPADASSAGPSIASLGYAPANSLFQGYNYSGNGNDVWTGPNAFDASYPRTTNLCLTAGNVFAQAPGATITSVKFYKNSVSAPNLLGTVTSPLTYNGVDNGLNLYQYQLDNISLSGYPAGSTTFLAVATDSNGRTSQISVAVTLS